MELGMHCFIPTDIGFNFLPCVYFKKESLLEASLNAVNDHKVNCS